MTTPVAPRARTAHTTAAEPDDSSVSTHDTWAVLDALSFDDSLSFLAEADHTPVPPLDSTRSSRPPALDTTGATTDRAALLTDQDVLVIGISDDSKVVAETSFTTSACAREADGSETVSPLSPPMPAATTEPDVPNPMNKDALRRAKKKQEMAYLRVQVAELESELATIQQHDDTAQDASLSTWKDIAKRQLLEKKRVENENATLRTLLEGQLRVAKSLEKLLRKRAVSETESLFMERKQLRFGPATLDLELAAREIRGRIAQQFATVDAVMKDCGLADVWTNHDDARATMNAANAIAMDLMTVKVFPFAVREVADAVWLYANPSNITSGAAPLGDLTELQFTIQLHVRRSEARLHVRGVCARRFGDDRTLIVFENVGVVEGPSFEGHGIQCREFGYIVIAPSAPTASSIGPSTVVKVCARMWPEAEVSECAGTDAARGPEAGLFVDLVLGLYNQHFQISLQAVENLLLSQARKPSE